MKLQKKSNIIAAVGTVLFMALLFLLLWFICLSLPQKQQDEGILVSFGESMDEGGGLPNADPYLPDAAEPTQSATPAQPQLTQEDPSVAQALKEEQERLEAEQRQREQEQREQQQAIANAQKMGALFGQTDSPDGANGQPGDHGSAKNGNPLGQGSSGGNKWSLKDRELIGALPQPENNFEQEGKVVVRITVDKEGNVVQAVIGTGTDISDEATRQLAIKAAKKAKFNMVDHPNAVMGTITYYFKFK